MKVGDKVYCKKDFLFTNKGKVLVIEFVDTNSYLIDGLHFFKSDIHSDWFFGDYFLTMKELRKKKLEKLENISNKFLYK